MQDIKTSIFGLIKGGALIYAGTQMTDPTLQYTFITAGLAAIGLGIVAKDSKKSSETTEQPGN